MQSNAGQCAKTVFELTVLALVPISCVPTTLARAMPCRNVAMRPTVNAATETVFQRRAPPPDAFNRMTMKQKMKLLTIVFVALSVMSTASFAAGSHSIRGHVTKKGTYVAPSRAANPDSTKRNNYTQKGNVNPHNGKKGTKN